MAQEKTKREEKETPQQGQTYQSAQGAKGTEDTQGMGNTYTQGAKGAQGKSSTAVKTNGGQQRALARQDTTGTWPWGSGPFGMMNRFANEMDRLFEGFGFGRNWPGRGFSSFGQSASTWSPEVEFFERDGELVVCADLPGMKKEDVKIQFEDGRLTIEGERKQEYEENGEGVYRSERSYGSFYRAIPIPEGVNAEDAKASFHDGVLKITMPAPKHQEQQHARAIEIE